MKILAVVEAHRVTSPVKLLLEFCAQARMLNDVPTAVRVATYVRKQSYPTELIAAAQSAGVSLSLIRERFRFDPGVVLQLCNLVEQYAPDIIQTEHVKSHFLVRLSRLHHRYPWIAFHHGYTTTDFKMLAYNRLNRWSLPAARRIITVSYSSACELSREGVPWKRLRVVHSAVQPAKKLTAAEVSAVRESLGLAPGERVVVAVGRLSDEKGHLDLVIAFKEVCERLQSTRLRLMIAGDGPERPRIEAMADFLGVRSRVTLVGHVADPAPYYHIADLMVLPSHREGSPVVLLEAMAAGLAIVATRVGGVPEIVTDRQDAILVPSRNPRALAEAMCLTLCDSNLASKLGANASHVIAEHYSPAKRACALMKIYREIIPTRSDQVFAYS